MDRTIEKGTNRKENFAAFINLSCVHNCLAFCPLVMMTVVPFIFDGNVVILRRLDYVLSIDIELVYVWWL